MTITKPILFDTNILVYNQNMDSPHFELAHLWHQRVVKGEIQGILSSQNILEFTAVMTSSRHLTKPLTPKQVSREISRYQHNHDFGFIYPNEQTVSVFAKLLKRYGLKNSRQSFDVFLVATMLSNNIKQLLTLNKKDFEMFEEIKLINSM